MDCTGVCFVTAVWKNCNFEHFGKGSKFTEKKILVYTRTPEDITTKYFRCVRRVAIKATSYLPISLPVRVKPLVCQRPDFCDVLD